MTNCLLKKYWYLTVVAVLFFASVSVAQTMTLTSAGDVIVWNQNNTEGVYVDPYQATVNGTPNTNVICDDWANNTYLNEEWNVNVTMASSTLSSNTPMFTGTRPSGITIGTTTYSNYSNLSQAQLYDALAYLAHELLNNPSVASNQVDYSFAMWELDYAATRNGNYGVTDPSNPYTFLSTSSNYSGEQGYVTTDILNALNQAIGGSPYDDSKWEILSPGSCLSGCQTTPPQEFLVYTGGNGNGVGGGPPSAPESSATLVFGADMLGLLGLAFVFRRRLLRTIQ